MADDSLTQDFDAHALFTFEEIPASPPLANRVARTRRWFVIAFTESWLAILLFRLKTRLRSRGVPVLPGLCDLIARALFRVQIGNRVEIGPGLMITHGHVVIDGQTRIGRDCQINPWVTIGLSNSKRLGFSVEGPTIGDFVHIGTGAKILGPVRIGDHARIGANAVVVHDVPANTTVVGAPAHPISGAASDDAAGDPATHDARLTARMRQSIVDYRLRRQSLRSLLDALHAAFETGSADLRTTLAEVDAEMQLLGSVAASENGDHTGAIIDALQAIDDELARKS